MPKILFEKRDKYSYYEIPKAVEVNKELIEEFQTHELLKDPFEKKIVSLPPQWKADKSVNNDFLKLLKTFKNTLFVPQESAQWSQSWMKLIMSGFSITEYHKALLWIAQKVPQTDIKSFSLGSTKYIKLSGSTKNKQNWDKVIQEAVESLQDFTIAQVPDQISHNGFTCWSYLKNALILDISNLFFIDPHFISKVKNVLRAKNLLPDLKGVYFITSGAYQEWLLKAFFRMSSFYGVGNIVRVTSANSSKNSVRAETNALCQLGKQKKLSMSLFTFEIQGYEKTLKALDDFYPEMIIVDEISDANALKEALADHLKEKVYHITPATSASVKILGPELITQGYDIRLFAEYLLSRYRNNHGSPNETYIYYLQSTQADLKRAVAFLQMEFAHILSDEYNKLLETFSTYETNEKQANFAISLLQEQILKLNIILPFSITGLQSFFSDYAKFFPKHYKTVGSFEGVKEHFSNVNIKASLHIVQGYNEVFFEEDGFLCEMRIQEQQNILIVNSSSAKSSEQKVSSLLSVMGENIFQQFLDKTLLSDLASLVWENATKEKKMILTLLTTKKRTKMRLEQGSDNSILIQDDLDLKEKQLVGTFPYDDTTSKKLMRIISLFFLVDQPSSDDTQWRFSCFDAVAKIVANYKAQQNIKIEFFIKGNHKKVVVSSNADAENPISEKAKKTLEGGVDQLVIDETGRCITLIKNPLDDTGVAPKKDVVEENALDEIESEKEREEAERSEKFQSIYDQALKAYNKKCGYDEESEDKEQVVPTTIRMARVNKNKILQKTQEGEERRAKIQRNILIGVASILLIFSLFVLYIFHAKVKPKKYKGGVLIDTDSNRFAYKKEKNTRKTPVKPPVATKKIVKNAIDPAGDLVRILSFKMGFGSPPNHDTINALLKKIYYAGKKMKTSADLQNINGRLYWYKLELNKKTKQFSDVWVKRWKKEATKSFTAAEKAYQANKTIKYNLKIIISRWKPEYKMKSLRKFIKYANDNEAAFDMRKARRYIAKNY